MPRLRPAPRVLLLVIALPLVILLVIISPPLVILLLVMPVKRRIAAAT